MKPRLTRPRLAALAAAALLLAAVPAARADQVPPSNTVTFDYKPGSIAMAPWMTQTGWDITHISFTYDATHDVMTVDLKTTGIAGDADGLGLQGRYDPQLIASGGYNPANLGGRDSISVAFMSANANHTVGSPIAIAGVPEYKPANAPNDGFQVSQYNGSPTLQAGYGAPIPGITGTLLNGGPSAQHPDFEFSITNFSKILGLTLTNGFYMSAYAGSPDDVVAGEDLIPWTYVKPLVAAQTVIGPYTPPVPKTPLGSPSPSLAPNPQIVPEPSSLALVGIGTVGLGFFFRGRRRAQAA